MRRPSCSETCTKASSLCRFTHSWRVRRPVSSLARFDVDKRIARGDQALELGPLVSAAPRGLLPEGFTPAQDQPHRAVYHFMDMRGKPLCAEHLRLEEPAHLGHGQRGDVAEPCGGQRTLAFGLHHAAVADE